MKAQRIVVKPGEQIEIRIRNNSRGPILLTQGGPATVVLVRSKVKKA
jgi:hypothetical protein